MPTERISFPSNDGQLLVGRLELPTGRTPSAFAVFAHCFTCTKNIRAAVAISRALARQGIGVLRFDFTGLGESDGEFADSSFSSNVSDLVSAAAYLSDRYSAPTILVGHSLGGAAVLQAASSLPTVRAVATIGAPSDPRHVIDQLRGSLDAILNDGEAEVLLAGRPFRIGREFVEDLYEAKVDEAVRTLGRSLLIFHSPIDETVGIDHAARLYEMAKHPKSFVSLDDADHLVSQLEDAEYIGAVLAAWARKYADVAPVDPHEGHDHTGHQVVVETGQSYTSEVWARGHSLVADEPKDIGGDDAGPTPYELVLAGLGACTGITLRMYADRKAWPLESVNVSLRREKLPPKGSGSSDPDQRADVIDRRLTLVGPLTEEQRARLADIANHCPVHKTLDAGAHIRTEVEPA